MRKTRWTTGSEPPMTEEYSSDSLPSGDSTPWAADERRRELMRIGRTLVPRFWGIQRTLAMYPPGNTAPQRSLGQFMEIVSQVHATGESAALVVLGDAAFLNGCRLRLDSSTLPILPKLSRFLDERGIGGVCIHRDPNQDRLMGFFAGLQTCNKHQQPRDALYELLGRKQIGEVTLIHPQRVQTDEQVEQYLKLEAVEAYARTMNSLRRTAGDDTGVVGFRRRQQIAVRRMVDLANKDFRTFLQLPALRGLATPMLEHTVNATVLSLALGKRAGLSRRPLLELGLAAMNRDTGEARAAGESPDVQRHPIRGMRLLLGRYGVGFRILLRSVVAAEHHRYHDGGGGYPELPRGTPHLFSAIIGLCTAYDALTCPRAGGDDVLPHQALRFIASSAGVAFDPRLVRIFLTMLGRHPPGSLVELDDEWLAVVLACGSRKDGQSRPIVLRFRDETGRDVPLQIEDLTQRDPKTGDHRHRVVRTLDPAAAGVNIPALLFSPDAALVGT